MKKQTIRDLDLGGKRVLMRVDFNVPLDEKRNVSDDTRIRAALGTIRFCLEQGASVVLMSHLGRPDGKVVEDLRLDPVARQLEKLLGKKVLKLNDCVGSKAANPIKQLKAGEIALLENLRFHPQEEENDPAFAKELAVLGDVYVNDAFGTAHRAHASTEGIARYLPSAAGFLMEKEIEYLGETLANPKRPFVAILGGSKVSGKIAVIDNLMKSVDAILIGGGMSYTFYKAKGLNVGNSRVESDKIPLALDLLQNAQKKNIPFVLPKDHRIARKIEKGTEIQTTSSAAIPDGWIGVDVGPQAIEEYKKVLQTAKTVVWNGPVGVFEIDGMDWGTRQVAEILAKLNATKIVGGGDTAAAIAKFGLESAMTHISTGGGASLEFMEGKVLPGVAVLTDKKETRLEKSS
ncbi:MAG: phosphoglycerate kinase [Candidatus Omnitrophica bacterium]|nr:phosphoglycerate kinase [Candidatus Omnitrophota bacterium]